ncbi:MAG: 50S ribosomal protein L1 [Rickettsiaceae bacterium]|nr:MAG: 50S ribosomal protein L1 [Rickettsiaceae bacterium]
MTAKTMNTTSMSKNFRIAKEKISLNLEHDFEKSISIIKEASYAKFDETLDMVLNLGVDPRHSDQMVRGIVSLPAGTGKDIRVAVVCKEDKVADAIEAGASIAGSTEVIDEIKVGKINFDVCIATPDMMALIGQVARILGPKGLMPNPKLGTVTNDVKTAVKNAKSGQVEFRVEKNGIIHAGIGKLSFDVKDLVSNAQVLIAAINKAKPTGAKGIYMKSVYLSSTMGPSVKIDLSSVNAINS